MSSSPTLFQPLVPLATDARRGRVLRPPHSGSCVLPREEVREVPDASGIEARVEVRARGGPATSWPPRLRG
jgi:hypothetical protein